MPYKHNAIPLQARTAPEDIRLSSRAYSPSMACPVASR